MSVPGLICPHPLAYANADEPHQGYTWYVFGDCVVPCPTIEYTDSEWKQLTNILIVFSAISMWMSFFSFVAHVIDIRKYYIQCMFIFGFLFNSVVISVFFAVNYHDNQVVCDTRSHFIERGDLCVFQAAAMVFSFVWVESWSVIFVYDMYLHVTYSAQAADIPKLRVKYTVAATALSLLAMLPPLLDRNLGFDTEANIPFCLNLVSKNNGYFWFTFFLPLCVLILFALLFAILSAIRMNQLFAVASPAQQQIVARFGVYDRLMGEGQGGLSTVPRLPSESSFNQSMSFYESDMDNSNNSVTEALLQSATATRVHTASERDDFLGRHASGDDFGYGDHKPVDTVSDSQSGSYHDNDDYMHGLSESEASAAGISSSHTRQSVDERTLVDRDGDRDADGERDEATAGRPSAGAYSVLSAVSGIFTTTGAQTSAQYNKCMKEPTAGSDQASSGHLRMGGGDSLGSASTSSSQYGQERNPRSSTTNSTGTRDLGYVSSAIKARLLSWLPPLWASYVEKTWKYNGLCIVFVMFFCLTTVCVAPLLYHLYQTTWQRTIDAGEDFAMCLVEASIASKNPNNPDHVVQTQENVDAYAAGICGTVPADRPNKAMVRSSPRKSSFVSLLLCTT